MLHCQTNHFAPVVLRIVQRIREIAVQHQVFQISLGIVGIADFLQKPCANDASAAPNLGDGGEVQRPFVFFLCFFHELKALCVCANFGTIQCIMNRSNDDFTVFFKR